jgi:E3 ubiquitin-protein ligase RNF14
MDDERQVEMDCISAIFPEMITDPINPFSASIELPVNPSTAVRVVFPAAAEGSTPPIPTPPPSEGSDQEGQPTLHPAHNVESHNLSHLPPLQLHITLPEGYPAGRAPVFELSTAPAWLSRAYLDELQDSGRCLWEEGGRAEVVYGYIDSLQQAAENAFGHSDGKALEVPQEFKIALLDYDIKATQAAFDKETFDCGVCLGKMTYGKHCGFPNFFQIQRRARLATA